MNAKRVTKSIAMFIIATLVLNAMVPTLAQAAKHLQGTKTDQTPIQRIKTPNAKVRVHAPIISKRRIIGEVVEMNRDMLVLKLVRMPWPQRREITANTVMTQDGQTFYCVPMSSISNLEVSMGQRRNTGKGVGLGLGLGLAVLIVTRIALADVEPGPGPGGAFVLVVGVGVAGSLCLLSTLLGAATKSEKWVEVSPQRLNLSIAPTSTKGIRAALEVNF